jgi:hypothetical protein
LGAGNTNRGDFCGTTDEVWRYEINNHDTSSGDKEKTVVDYPKHGVTPALAQLGNLLASASLTLEKLVEIAPVPSFQTTNIVRLS